MFTFKERENLSDEQLADLIHAYVRPEWGPSYEERCMHLGAFEANVCVIHSDETSHLPFYDDIGGITFRLFEYGVSSTSYALARSMLCRELFLLHVPRQP